MSVKLQRSPVLPAQLPLKFGQILVSLKFGRQKSSNTMALTIFTLLTVRALHTGCTSFRRLLQTAGIALQQR